MAEARTERTTRARPRHQRSDTTLRCLAALVIVRVAMTMVVFAAKQLSATHPARHLHVSAVEAWRAKMDEMPWRGFVPTAGFATANQIAVLVIAVVVAFVFCDAFGIPRPQLPDHPITHFENFALSR